MPLLENSKRQKREDWSETREKLVRYGAMEDGLS